MFWAVGCPVAFRRTDFDLCRTAADAGRREAVARRFPQKGTRPCLYEACPGVAGHVLENRRLVVLASCFDVTVSALWAAITVCDASHTRRILGAHTAALAQRHQQVHSEDQRNLPGENRAPSDVVSLTSHDAEEALLLAARPPRSPPTPSTATAPAQDGGPPARPRPSTTWRAARWVREGPNAHLCSR